MKIKSILVVAGLTACLFALPVKAGELEDGYAAFARGDYTNALKLLKPLADQGNVGAQVQLGMMYEDGLGVSRDYAEALKLFRLAAEQGYFAAQYNLSAMYSKGTGVNRDPAEAAKWLKRSAEQGFGQAQFMLGRMYSLGRELPSDYVQAYMWYSLAASNRAFDDFLQNASKHERSKFAEQKMTPNQISQARQLTIEWAAVHPEAVANPVYQGK